MEASSIDVLISWSMKKCHIQTCIVNVPKFKWLSVLLPDGASIAVKENNQSKHKIHIWQFNKLNNMYCLLLGAVVTRSCSPFHDRVEWVFSLNILHYFQLFRFHLKLSSWSINTIKYVCWYNKPPKPRLFCDDHLLRVN